MKMYGVYRGCTVLSVHKDMQEAVKESQKRGFTVRRRSNDHVVFEGENNVFGSAGGVFPVNIEPSQVYGDGRYCLKGAEVDPDGELTPAAHYYWIN